MLDKIDEIELIILGEDKDEKKYEWLKKKFDGLRIEAKKTESRTAFFAGLVAGVLVTLPLVIIIYLTYQ